MTHCQTFNITDIQYSISAELKPYIMIAKISGSALYSPKNLVMFFFSNSPHIAVI